MKSGLLILLLATIATNLAHSQTLALSFEMPVSAAWYDTKIQLVAGETVTITANGSVYIGALGKAKADLIYETPSGTPHYVSRSKTPYLAPDLAPWSLIGRIGPTGEAFAVGENATITVTEPGELYLSINDNHFPDNSDTWNVTVQNTSATTEPTIVSEVNIISVPSATIGPVVKLADGSMQINLSGPAGTYEVDASINLIDWELLGYLTLNSPTGQFIDSSAPNFDARFYRAMLLK